MTKKQKSICEKLGWNVLSDENDIILSQYSPAGEDFSFYAEKTRFKDSVKEYAEDFDPDEHATM